MATGFNTQVGNGEYRLQFETDNREYYLLMQKIARRCVDGKPMTNADCPMCYDYYPQLRCKDGFGGNKNGKARS